MTRHQPRPWPLVIAAAAAITVTAGVGAAAQPAAAEPQSPPHAVSFDSADAFNAATRDRHIAVTDAGRVQLRAIEYLSHDIGNRIDRVSTSDTLRGRKTFDLGDQPQAQGAKLYIIGGRGEATFNGEPITFEPMPFGGWSVARIDAHLLQPGINIAEFGPGFRLHLDRDRPDPAHSFIAEDGSAFQPAAGEILARLRVERHPAQGSLTSPVIDLAQPDDADVIRPDVRLESIALEYDADTPEPTHITLEARTGPTLRPEDGGWSDWAAPETLSAIEPQRYVQWRATLRTDDRSATPVLQAVRVEAQRRVMHDPADQGLTVREFDNRHIVRASQEFTFQEPSDRLTYLRENWNLDEIIAEGETDLERLVLLRNWVRRQWPHNDGGPKRPWDAIDILAAPESDVAPAGQHGMCVHFAVAFAQSALALGYNARQVILSGHYVAEAWVPELDQWVLMDVETVQKLGWHDHGTAKYRDTDTGKLMTALDLHRARAEERTDRIQQLIHMTDDAGEHQPHEITLPYEQYKNFRRFALVTRNNHLDQLEPWEEAHGFDHYRSDAYLWWADSSPEYTRFTHREGDWNWTVHQAQVRLTATEDAGTLAVMLDTMTPNFAAYEYRFNEGPWQRTAGEGDAPHSRRATLDWPLEPGVNTLEVRAVNAFDVAGTISRVVVER